MLLIVRLTPRCPLFFFFNDTATTEIYTLSLHDALPICRSSGRSPPSPCRCRPASRGRSWTGDRKSTRLNSSHLVISYAVFCLKKKNKLPDVLHPVRGVGIRDVRLHIDDVLRLLDLFEHD